MSSRDLHIKASLAVHEPFAGQGSPEMQLTGVTWYTENVKVGFFRNLLEECMRMSMNGFGVSVAILPCLFFSASGQDKAAQSREVQKEIKIEKMRSAANTKARALATVVQFRAIKINKYDGVLSSYAKDLGGTLPINPCTGTRTGFTIVVRDKGQTATVSAKQGTKCGKWTPTIFNLTL